MSNYIKMSDFKLRPPIATLRQVVSDEWSYLPKDQTLPYRQLLRTLEWWLPDTWDTWVVNRLSKEDVFGEASADRMASMVRFALPEHSVAGIFGRGSPLSVEEDQQLRQVLLSWELGRALVTHPPFVSHAIHNSYNFPHVVHGDPWTFDSGAPLLPPLAMPRWASEEQRLLLNYIRNDVGKSGGDLPAWTPTFTASPPEPRTAATHESRSHHRQFPPVRRWAQSAECLWRALGSPEPQAPPEPQGPPEHQVPRARSPRGQKRPHPD